MMYTKSWLRNCEGVQAAVGQEPLLSILQQLNRAAGWEYPRKEWSLLLGQRSVCNFSLPI